MINLSVFCPLERVGANLINVSQGWGFDKIMIEIPIEDRERTFFLTYKYLDQNLGLTEGERLWLLRQPKIVGKVTFIGKETSSKTLIINHCLRTDHTAPQSVTMQIDGQSKKVYNGRLLDGSKVCYPEALTTIGSQTHVTVRDQAIRKISVGTRPYFDYVLIYKDDSRIVIDGPRLDEVELMSKLEFEKDGRSYNIITSDDSVEVVKDDVIAVADITDVIKSDMPSAVFKYGDVEVPYIFGQITQTIDGRVIKCNDILKVMKIISFFEIALKDNAIPENGLYDETANKIVFKIRQIGKQWTLEQEIVDFFNVYCVDNEVLNEVYNRFEASDDYLYITDNKGVPLRLVGSSSVESCHALSLACLFAFENGKDTSLTDFICSLRSLVESEILVNDGEGHLKGTTAGMIGKTIRFKGWAGPLSFVDSFEFVRSDYSADQVKALTSNGIFMLGVELNGEPGLDHYVVCKKQGDSVIALYDPWYKTRRSYGDPVNDLLTSQNLAITFKGKAFNKGVSVTLSEKGLMEA